MTELETYVKLKYYPPKGTNEYLNSLPPAIPYKLYEKLFADGEIDELVEARLLHILSNPLWKTLVWKNLEAILIDYYEAHEINQ